MRRKICVYSAVCIVALVALGAGYIAGMRGVALPISSGVAATIVTQGAQPVSLPSQLPMTGIVDFSSIVDRFGPAVVNISTASKVDRPALGQDDFGIDPDDPFFEFFRRFRSPSPRIPRSGVIRRGQGSGFIIRSDGLILTNAHVVNGAQDVIVKLTDRREMPAKVLGLDKQTDIAVIKIEANNLPTVIMGDSSKARVGEPVLAIGSPYGFDSSASSGIISAKSRHLDGESYVPFIQTDVAVNRGNSGGPLFNLRGEVIGINSQIFSHTGGFQGLSFAIPINVATHIKDQLLAHGKITRGRLGVMIQEVNQALADSFGLKTPQGALVADVEKDGPADKAGIQEGDIILKIDHLLIEHSHNLAEQIASMKPGTKTTIELMRRGGRKVLSATVGSQSQDKVSKPNPPLTQRGKLGLSLRALTQDEQRMVGVKGGLVVQSSMGVAAEAGIQSGDIVLALNGVPLKDVHTLNTLLEKVGKRIALLILRDSERRYIAIDLD